MGVPLLPSISLSGIFGGWHRTDSTPSGKVQINYHFSTLYTDISSKFMQASSAHNRLEPNIVNHVASELRHRLCE